MIGAHEPRLHERPIGGESKERQPDRGCKQAEEPERLAAGRRLAPSAGEVKRQRETRNQQHREMNEDGASSRREARQQVGIGIAGKQRRLEEHHRDRPDSGSAAQPWQHHLGEHRLDRKQQRGTHQDGREKGSQQQIVGRGGGLDHSVRGELESSHVPTLCALLAYGEGFTTRMAGRPRHRSERSGRVCAYVRDSSRGFPPEKNRVPAWPLGLQGGWNRDTADLKYFACLS